ncbi:MAG: acyl-CoA dehydrogenase family protein [Rhizomicrobium sp.]
MDFDDTPEDARFRAEARAWLVSHAPAQFRDTLERATFGYTEIPGHDPVLLQQGWQKTKFDAGWACVNWPRAYGGRDATPIQRAIWQQEEGVYARLSQMFLVGHGMCGPTLMAYATEEQKRARLPPLASGEEIWCQLFSEPAAGSDLAGLRTRAEKHGAEWVVNGQKIWTSEAQHARWGLLLARSDPDALKHKGLTMFFVRMDSPGIEVRPIRQMNEQSVFNEVYFSDVRIPDAQRLGGVGEGWRVALTTLMNERLSVGASMQTGFEELFAYCCELPTASGVAADERHVQSRLAQFAVRASGLRYTALRGISQLSKGEEPGPESSIGKLVAGTTMQEIAKFALDLQGECGLLCDPAQAPAMGRFQAMLMRAPATRIEGGSDEILRNIIAERVLGLPPDIRADKDVPFSKIAASART